jgi:hypothetical protein
MDCPRCGTPAGPHARFCSRCGIPMSTPTANTAKADAAPARRDLDIIDGMLVWNLHPGQVARKLRPGADEGLRQARGLIIQDGTRALIFADGRLAAELQSGTFPFDRPAPGTVAGKTARGGGIFSFLGSRNTTRTADDGAPEPDDTPGRSPVLSVLLIRQGSLPLIATLREVRTATVTTTVALQLMIEISDPLAFSRTLMQVRSELGLNALATALMGVVESALRQTFQRIPAEEIVPDPALESRLAAALTQSLGKDWEFIRMVRVAKVTAHREEFAKLHAISDATYLSDRALHQASVRSEFANRLREQRNRQRIDEAASVQHLHTELQRINRDGLVSQDDLAQFEAMLEHGRRLREARTEDEYQRELAELRRNELVREDGVLALARTLADQQRDQGHRRSHALALFDLSRQLEMDQARLQWEYDVGDKRLALALERRLREHLGAYEVAAVAQAQRRLEDDYADERRQRDQGDADRRRRSEHEHEHRERLSQLELARQAQDLSDRRRREEHARELATATQRAQEERDRSVAEAQSWAGMSVEQIMAANPALSPAAAASLATKYTAESVAQAEKAKAEAAAIGDEHRARAAEHSRDELRDFMTNQLATMQDLVRHTLEANARIANAFAQGGRAAVAAPVAAEPAFCSRCGRRLEAGTCPVCQAPQVS